MSLEKDAEKKIPSSILKEDVNIIQENKKIEYDKDQQAENTEEARPQKKASPFLTTEVAENEEQEEEDPAESATTTKQHEQIDRSVSETCIFNTVGKLYFLSKKTSKLETRGEGKIMILKDLSGLFKVLMIRDQVMLKGCNHYVAASCPLVKASQVPNSWVWTALNDKSDAEKNEEKTTYFARFKTEEDFKLFEEKYNFAMTENVKTLEILKSKEKKSVL